MIHAVERENLHCILIDALEPNPNIQLKFEHKISDWDPQTGVLTLIDDHGVQKTVPTELVTAMRIIRAVLASRSSEAEVVVRAARMGDVSNEIFDPNQYDDALLRQSVPGIFTLIYLLPILCWWLVWRCYLCRFIICF